MNEHCGTSRTASGLLSDAAGKVLPLDRIASQFFSAAVPERPAFVQQARDYLAGLSAGELANKANASAQYYLKAMERITDKGEGWLVKEQAR